VSKVAAYDQRGGLVTGESLGPPLPWKDAMDYPIGKIVAAILIYLAGYITCMLDRRAARKYPDPARLSYEWAAKRLKR